MKGEKAALQTFAFAKGQRTEGNILLVANYASDVGYAWWLMENFWVQIAKYASKRSKKCFLLYPKITTVPPAIAESSIQLIEGKFAFRPKPVRERLKKIIRDNDIRFIYLTDKKNYGMEYFSLRRWGVEKIVVHDHAPGERPPAPMWKRMFKSSVHALGWFSCDHYIGVSKFVYDRFLESGCIPAAKCSYVLNGIHPIAMHEDYQNYARQQFSIPAEAVIVVTTGRATYYKGIDFLIRCAHALINEQGKNNVYFLYCGDGPDLDAFRSQTRECNLDGKFIFGGRRSDISRILQSCDIGVQASQGEAFSLSILEYMSAGLATVVPDNCGNKEAISSGENGVLYPPRDHENLVRTLSALIDDEQYRKKLAASAVDTVNRRFTIEKANREFVEVISRIF